MRKILALALAVLTVAAVAPGASADDVNGPPCADIASGNGTYSGGGQLNAVLTLGDAPCRAFDYTLHVQTAGGVLDVSPDQVINGNQLLFQAALNPTANATICVYATVSVGRGTQPHVFDLAPDTPVDCDVGLNVVLGGAFATSFN